MTRFFLGANALRIMKNDADDPELTPSTEYDKFLFDSLTEEIAYVQKLYNEPRSVSYDPPGSNASTCVFDLASNSSIKQGFFYPGRALGDDQGMYLAECRPVRQSTGLPRIGEADITYGTDPGGDYADTGFMSIWNSRMDLTTQFGNSGTHDPYGNVYMGISADNRPILSNYLFSVWNLSMENSDDYSVPSDTPVTGQKVVHIAPDEIKVARQGFDVDTATGRQFLVDSGNIPAKILRTGVIASLASSATVDVTVPIDITSDVYVDGIFTDVAVGALTIPGASVRQLAASSRGVYVDYEVVDARTIRLYNRSAFAITGRYIIFAGGDGETAGAGPCFRQDDDYIQLCRNGAAVPPNLDDILIDTRLSYVPMVAHGFISAGDFVNVTDSTEYQYFGHKKYRLSLDLPAGTVAYPKFMFTGVRTSLGLTYRAALTPQYELVWNGQNSAIFGPGANCKMAVLGDGYIDFFQSSNGYTGFNPTSTGGSLYNVKYYIFAIPDTL